MRSRERPGQLELDNLATNDRRRIHDTPGDAFDAHLFAPVRTFRISQLTGFNFSTGPSISPLAPLGIPATPPQTFIRLRDLISARRHALLQLFLPIDNDVDLLGSPVGNVRQRRHDETLTVGRDVVRRRIT
jgi:hypothetical protein